MLNQAEIQQESAPTRKRIGRARFLLEFIIAAVITKVGSEAFARTTSGAGVVIPLLLFGIGFFLAIWASMRRLRDIKRSEWWVTVPIVPLLLGLVLGLTGLSGPDVTANTYVKAVGIAYMVVYLLFLGVLLFWPSAFPKGGGGAAMTGFLTDIEDRAFAQAATELNTDHRDAGVWARAYSDAEGDENRAKALYIRYRAQRICK